LLLQISFRYPHTGSLSIKSEIPAGLEISLQMARIITSNKQTFLADASGEISEGEISTPTKPAQTCRERKRNIPDIFIVCRLRFRTCASPFLLEGAPKTPPHQRHMWLCWPQHFKISHPSALVFSCVSLGSLCFPYDLSLIFFLVSRRVSIPDSRFFLLSSDVIFRNHFFGFLCIFVFTFWQNVLYA